MHPADPRWEPSRLTRTRTRTLALTLTLALTPTLTLTRTRTRTRTLTLTLSRFATELFVGLLTALAWQVRSLVITPPQASLRPSKCAGPASG